MKTFASLFLAEVGAAAFAMGIFGFVSDRQLAGLWAGAVFVALGLVIGALGARRKAFRATWTFWLGCVFLLGVSLPMMVTRMITLGRQFEDVSVLGISGTVFHGLARIVYVLLMVGTLADLASELRNPRSSGRADRPL